ncbi:MAG: hypothetical protein FJ087_03970 [Deltaproteobacteria bacterium]|nr:hypothetical protein [Deltaproteobacteria bacterium]
MRRTAAIGAACCALASPAAVIAQGIAEPAPKPFVETATFTVQGFVQNQTGVFVAPDESAEREYRPEPTVPGTMFPSNHGDRLGRLSMLRNTLQLEADWHPHRRFSLHAIVRGVVSLPLSVDREAQVPDAGYLSEPERRVRWVSERFYQEADLREIWLDWTPHDLVTLRLGRQLVAWGESGQARLRDVVNPIDSTWHFGALESFEDQRLPLWMLRAMVEVPPLRGALDVVWIPMVPFVERPEDTVTTPLTFVGAWGLPQPPLQGDTSVMPQKIHSKVFGYPEQTPESSRVGARWRGEVGPIAYSLMYFWGHQLTPPIPAYYVTSTGGINDVWVRFPRMHVAGLSLEYNVPFPVSTMLKLEATVEPDRTYAPQSEADPAGFESLPDGSTKTIFRPVEKFTANYALTIQQPAIVRFLNPSDVVVVALQFAHSFLPTFDKDEKLLEVPGYDSTLLTKHQFRLGGSIFTSYLHGMITPRITGAWLFGYDGLRQGFDKDNLSSFEDVAFRNAGGFLSVSCQFAFGDHWRMLLALNQFFGDDPYYGAGFYRDRDEVNLTVRYQF